MAQFLTIPAGRTAKWVVFAVFLLVTGFVSSQYAGKFEEAQDNETSSFLPGKAESVKALDAVKQYEGGELAPAVIVYERRGGLTDADRKRVADDRASFVEDRPDVALEPQKPVFSENGDAALFVLPIQATGDSDNR